MADKRLFLIDAYALIYRAYYALIRAPRYTSKGLNTSAIFGFCNTLDEVLRKENPDYIAVCFDPAGPTFRHKMYEDYKAKREKQPEDITLSIPYIKEIIAAYRIPIVEVEGYEADDVIGTLAHRASESGFITYMMTPDKDYGQLVTDRVLQYRPSLRGQDGEIRGPKEICEKFGIQRPSQVIDLLALEGDASDNIPGCPGIGEVTARKLIAQFGSVDNMLDHTDEITGATRKKVESNVEQIRFSKILATIDTNVPVDIPIEDLRRNEPDMERLLKVFNQLEFRSFIARLTARGEIPQVESAPVAAKVGSAGHGSSSTPSLMGSLFDAIDDEPKTPKKTVITISANGCTIADSPAKVAEAVAAAMTDKTVGISLFAIGEDAMSANWTHLALAWGEDQTVCIPVPDRESRREEMKVMLEPLFSSPEVTLVSADIKRNMVILHREGIELSAKYYDVSIAHYLLKPEGKHNLDSLVFDMTGYRTMCYDLSDPDRRKECAAVNERTPARLCEAAQVVLRLLPVMEKAIAEAGQTALMDEIELPFARVLASMEWEGARIDVSELAKLSISLSERMEKLEKEAYALAGEEFNIGSPIQVGEILFGKMQIDPKAKKTKTGAWSTTEDILLKYRHEHLIVEIILKVRALRKLLTTYVDALPRLINPLTGKVHTTYNQTVTATGRISSTNPNLQNIPIRTDDGREIRRAFIPDPGDLMLSADYSQIELRLMADFSGDPDMIEAFASGEDIHRATAAKIYHLPIGEVTDSQRRNAKTANFGIIYGISAFGLSERLGIPRAEAKMLIDGYLQTYPGVANYISQAVADAREKGYVATIKGRKRFLPDINSHNSTVRGYAERNAVNAPLQGSAADIIKIAMIQIYRDIREAGLQSRMILQVHDELVFNVKPDELAKVQEIVARDMEGAYSGKVALEVSAGVGRNWLEAH